ncbi:Golgi apparatus membrane protein-like protein ECHIDNA [Glycine soja]
MGSIRSCSHVSDYLQASSALMDPNQPVGENYANPRTCFFHVLFKAAALAFYILSALFIDNFVIIFVVTVLLAALDFWVVKNVSGRILVGLRWWNEINDLGESVWKFECLDHESLARMNKKDSWLFWWTLYLTAILWIVLAIFSLIRLQADYLLVVGVCLTLSIANIVGFTKCKKDAKKQIQQFASQTIASRFSSTLQSAFSVV